MEKLCCPVNYKLVLTDLNMPNMDGFDAAILILDYQKKMRE
jgi:CheY-like chemotaxis protein